MAGRPEILFPLFADVQTLPGVGPKVAKHMAQIGIETPRDLIFLLPHGVIDRRRRDTIKGAPLPGTLTVEVEVVAHRPAARFLHTARRTEFVRSDEADVREENKAFYRALWASLQPFVERGELTRLPQDLYAPVIFGGVDLYLRMWLAGQARTPPEQAGPLLAEASWRAITP